MLGQAGVIRLYCDELCQPCLPVSEARCLPKATEVLGQLVIFQATSQGADLLCGTGSDLAGGQAAVSTDRKRRAPPALQTPPSWYGHFK